MYFTMNSFMPSFQGAGGSTVVIVPTVLWGLVAYGIINAIYNIYLHPLSRFPGPRIWQVNYFFRLKASIKGNLDESIKDFHAQYGPVVRYSPNELSFASTEAWKDIYGYHEHALPKDEAFYGLIHLSRDRSHSIFTADEAQHPRVRKALSYAFSERALRDQEPIIKQYVDLLMQRLHEIGESKNPTADLVEWYNFTTFDIIGDLAIGRSFNCLHDSQYHDWVNGFWKTIKLGAYVKAVAMATHPVVPQLLRILAPRSLKEARQHHLEYVGKSTEERLLRGVSRQESGLWRPDFISYVMNSKREGEGETLSDGEIEANTNFLLLAGTETTATALSGTTFYLLKTPEALRKATEEVRRLFTSDNDITAANSAERLPYLQACLTEGLRIYPPGPVALPRKTPERTVTMIAGHAVPGGVTVGVHSWSTSHSSQNFHEASSFVPERWLPEVTTDPSSPFYGDRRAASQPFSYGPRNCLGKPFAQNETRVILARVLWNFDMELLPESKMWDKQRVFSPLWDKGPLMVRMKSRRGAI